MGRSGKRGLLGKLAFGLLILCFVFAGTNMFIFNSMVETMENGMGGGEKPIKNVNSTSEKADTQHRLDSKHNKPPDPTKLFHNQRNKAISTKTSPKPPAQNQPMREKSRDGAIYRCSYGPTNENRTTVVVPNNEPAFIIIGVQKSGTTSLLSHFRDHPQVLQSKLKLRRELHFFDGRWGKAVEKEWERLGLKQANDKHCLALQQYMKLFETETILANSQTMDHGSVQQNTLEPNGSNSTHHLPLFTFDKTPSYFDHYLVPARMKRTVPWSKAILILRDPVERLYSSYKMTVKVNHNLRKYSLEDFVFHELKAMKKFGMTNAPLMVPVDIKEGNNETDPSIPTIADHYELPSVPLDHAVIDPAKWKPKTKALVKKPDQGPLSKHGMLRRGLYSLHLRWWLKKYTVGKDLLVIKHDDLAKDIRSVFEQISFFAGIPVPYAKGQDPAEVGIHFDEKARARKDNLPMKEETRKFLREFYAPYTAELESMLGPEWGLEKLGWNDAKKD